MDVQCPFYNKRLSTPHVTAFSTSVNMEFFLTFCVVNIFDKVIFERRLRLVDYRYYNSVFCVIFLNAYKFANLFYM